MTPQIEAWFRARIFNPRLLARVLAANAQIQDGELIRGWHRTQAHRPDPALWIGRGAVIRRHGRATWDAIPERHRCKQGKRAFASLIGAAIVLGRRL